MKKPVATPNMYFQGIVLERKKERKKVKRQKKQSEPENSSLATGGCKLISNYTYFFYHQIDKEKPGASTWES